MFRRILAAVLAVAVLFVPVPALATLSAVADPPPLKILALGDSISELHPSQPELDWQTYLSALLTAAGVDHVIITEATGGKRCGDFLSTSPSEVRTLADLHDPDITIIACGTNDAANGITGPGMDLTYWFMIDEAIGGHPETRVLGTWIQYSASRPANAAAIRAGEAVVNDAIYRQTIASYPYTAKYVHGSRIIGTADMQQIPEHYLDSGGIHPTAAGYEAMARIYYNRLRLDPAYPWPDIAAPLCGMTGSRPGYGPSSYSPCTVLAT